MQWCPTGCGSPPMPRLGVVKTCQCLKLEALKTQLRFRKHVLSRNTVTRSIIPISVANRTILAKGVT